MSTNKPLNTIPLQQFIERVKGAENSKSNSVNLTISEAKNLAFTIGAVMSRLHGDLEKLIHEKNNTTIPQTISVSGLRSQRHAHSSSCQSVAGGLGRPRAHQSKATENEIN